MSSRVFDKYFIVFEFIFALLRVVFDEIVDSLLKLVNLVLDHLVDFLLNVLLKVNAFIIVNVIVLFLFFLFVLLIELNLGVILVSVDHMRILRLYLVLLDAPSLQVGLVHIHELLQIHLRRLASLAHLVHHVAQTYFAVELLLRQLSLLLDEPLGLGSLFFTAHGVLYELFLVRESALH